LRRRWDCTPMRALRASKARWRVSSRVSTSLKPFSYWLRASCSARSASVAARPSADCCWSRNCSAARAVSTSRKAVSTLPA